LENRKFGLDLKETLSTLNLDWAKFGHTKDTDYETAKLAREKFLLDVKKYGFDVAKQKASDEQWWADFGLKDRESQELAIREAKKFALEIDKFGLDEAVKRHGMGEKTARLGLDIRKEENVMIKWKEKKRQWTKEFGAKRADAMFDQKMRGLKYESDVADTDRTHKLNVEKFGEEKADNMRTYQLDDLKEKHAWKETLFDMGFKKEEFVEKTAEFWATLTETKEEREERARQYDTTEERLREQDARAMDEFEKNLKLEYKQLDLDVKQFGLNTEIEARVAKMALLDFGLDVKKYGLDEAIHKFEVADADKKWYWREKEWPLKEKEAETKYKEVMHRVTQDAKKFGLDEAIHKENIRQFDEKMRMDWAKLDEKEKKTVAFDCFDKLTTTCIGFSDTEKNELTQTWKALFNKEGQIVEPAMGDRNRAEDFVVGAETADTDDEPRTKEELPVNMNESDYVRAVLQTTTFNRKQKAWLLWKRFTPMFWEGMQRTAGTLGNLSVVSPDIVSEEKPETHWFFKPAERALEKAKQWWTGEKSEETKSTGNIREDVNTFLGEYGMDQTPEGIRKFLIGLGWKDDQINALGIK